MKADAIGNRNIEGGLIVFERILFKIRRIPFLGTKVFNLFVKREGGQTRSMLLRRYFEKQNIKVGLYSYGGCFSEGFNNGGKVEIGRYCSIAEHVSYFGANHPMNYLSQSAIFYNKTLGLNVKDVERSKLVIGNDVWIGYGVIITAKCKKIGNGAVVGAGSIVTRDIPPYSIVAGNPAKIIRMRFNSELSEEIEKAKWWELKPEELYEFYEYMDNPETLIIKMGECYGK